MLLIFEGCGGLIVLVYLIISIFVNITLELVIELEDAAFALKQGEVSQVIRTRHGFHILKAGERKPEEQLAFGDVEETIREDLEEKKFEQVKHDTLERLRREIPVLIYLKSD